ncbi:hypothetical protein CPC08DRAFT_709395, partial [Agrocybe pediades]
ASCLRCWCSLLLSYSSILRSAIFAASHLTPTLDVGVPVHYITLIILLSGERTEPSPSRWAPFVEK